MTMGSGAGVFSRLSTAVEGIESNGFPGAVAVCPSDPSTYDTAVADPRFVVGGLYFYSGLWYKYEQFVDAVTYVATHALEWANVSGLSVTNDRAAGSALGRIAAGKATRVHTANRFGFMQVSGPCTLLTSGADDIAVAESVFCHATTDGTVDGASASTYATGQIGVATEADDNTANTVKVILWLPL